jgi:hypothetical protein
MTKSILLGPNAAGEGGSLLLDAQPGR